MRRITIDRDRFRLAEVFTISRGSRTHADVLCVQIEEDGRVGRGECVPYARYGESLDSVTGQLVSVQAALAGGAGRREVQALLPPGAARNAIDCALWDLEAKQAGRPAWDLAGLARPGPVVSAFTLSLDTPAIMGEKARENAHRPLLKIKLTGEGDLERVASIRQGAPQSRLVVDANEGWTPAHVRDFTPRLAELGVSMIEQPLPAGQDEALGDLPHPVPFCADESCHDVASLDSLKGRYEMVNIKLDKTGGLTEALALRSAARSMGFQVMVGCMVGSSLAMAPAFLVAQGADLVDLDGPLLLAEDRTPSLRYEGSTAFPPDRDLWG